MSSSSDILLQLDQTDRIIEYVRDRGWIDEDEDVIDIHRAGEGNMNLVVRIQLAGRSFILKQSRPWVEKYPQIAAPRDRLLVEVAFFETVQSLPVVADAMPDLLAVDRDNRVAILEDLGKASDFTSIYREPYRIQEHLPELCAWLSALHAGPYPEDARATLENKAMRALNHEHIFHFPLVRDNQFDLDAITPGLQEEGDRLKHNAQFVDAVTTLGQRYLNAGRAGRDVLLHGDFYPGSWLDTGGGIRIIDPEFGFFGDAEFDVGVFMAHMMLARCSEDTLPAILDRYEPPPSFQPDMALQYAGVEIMRRLIGVAQLPVELDVHGKAALLREAERLVLGASSFIG